VSGEGTERTIFEAAGGERAMLALARAWHERCLADPVASHPFSHPGQHPQHVERLAAYWAEALGGPAVYSERMGDHSYVLHMHSGKGEHEDLDRRVERCFELAVDDAGFPQDERLRSTLTEWFRWANGGMAVYPRSADEVPSGLGFPRWSWDGPVLAP
jgi:hemoglobin